MEYSTIKLEHHPGKNNKHDIVFFGLTSCGFCKKALTFLDSHDADYRYIFVDTITIDEKVELKKNFMDQFGTKMLFPSAVIDDKKILTGFIKPSWESSLELKKGN